MKRPVHKFREREKSCLKISERPTKATCRDQNRPTKETCR